MQANIADYWSQIELWLEAHVPVVVPMLPPGAAAAAFDRAEETLGYALPQEIKEFLAIHDGSGHLWLHDYGEFRSLAGLMEAWEMECELWADGHNDEWAAPHGPIKKKWFTREWLPILDARTGDYVCIDLDPPQNGQTGQLITWHHDGGPQEVIASSLGALVAEFVAELAAGHYRPKVDDSGRPYLEFVAGGLG